MSFLQAAGDAEWPDGTVAAKFRFRHSLYREVVSTRVTASRRAPLHHRIGERQETAFGARAVEIAAELARHFRKDAMPIGRCVIGGWQAKCMAAKRIPRVARASDSSADYRRPSS